MAITDNLLVGVAQQPEALRIWSALPALPDSLLCLRHPDNELSGLPWNGRRNHPHNRQILPKCARSPDRYCLRSRTTKNLEHKTTNCKGAKCFSAFATQFDRVFPGGTQQSGDGPPRTSRAVCIST